MYVLDDWSSTVDCWYNPFRNKTCGFDKEFIVPSVIDGLTKGWDPWEYCIYWWRLRSRTISTFWDLAKWIGLRWVVIWQGYEEVEFELRLMTRGALAFWDILGRDRFTRTGPAGFEDIFCAKSFVLRIGLGSLRSSPILWKLVTLIGFFLCPIEWNSPFFSRLFWAQRMFEVDFLPWRALQCVMPYF